MLGGGAGRRSIGGVRFRDTKSSSIYLARQLKKSYAMSLAITVTLIVIGVLLISVGFTFLAKSKGEVRGPNDIRNGLILLFIGILTSIGGVVVAAFS